MVGCGASGASASRASSSLDVRTGASRDRDSNASRTRADAARDEAGEPEGERPTRVRNKDPLKPLPVPGKFLRPIIDPERAPPRPKDGIGI